MEPIRRSDVCLVCFQRHHLRKCKIFNGFSIRQRLYSVKVHRYCLNCLSQSHQVKDCTTASACRRCGKNHHTLLHKESAQSNVVSSPPRRSVQERLQLPIRDLRIPNRVAPPQQRRRSQHSVRSASHGETRRDTTEDSGALTVANDRRRRSRRRPTMVQRQLADQAAGQATTHQLLRQMIATMNRLSDSILAPVQRGRHVEARDSASETADEDCLDLDIEPLL